MRMALALTLMRTILPFTTARTFWILGLNLREEMPVILVPTPPRYLALPRWVFWCPKLVFLPVKKHTRGIQSPHFSGQDSVGGQSRIASPLSRSMMVAAAQIVAGHHRIVAIHRPLTR